MTAKKPAAASKPAAKKKAKKKATTPKRVKPPEVPEPAVQELGEAEKKAEASKGPARVDSFDVFSEPGRTVRTLNGSAYELDREALLAVAKLLNAARVETVY